MILGPDSALEAPTEWELCDPVGPEPTPNRDAAVAVASAEDRRGSRTGHRGALRSSSGKDYQDSAPREAQARTGARVYQVY